jgi:hypothetical protein
MFRVLGTTPIPCYEQKITGHDYEYPVRERYWHPVVRFAKQIGQLNHRLGLVRKKSVRDEFVNKNLREMLDCSH